MSVKSRWMSLLLGLVMSLSVQASTGHAYSAEAGLARIDRRNADFDTPLAVVGPVPAANARITQVSYRWRYDNPPAGLSMLLCQQRGRCTDVTDANERLTVAFVGANPAQPFYFRARVAGQGAMAPVLGYAAQIVVNWIE
jgi:hypothetical protein